MLYAACPPDLFQDLLEKTALHYGRACCGGASTNAWRKRVTQLHALLAAVFLRRGVLQMIHQDAQTWISSTQ
jgi:predicted secreted protein